MQPGIEFHGRLSRSDRRPANPGQYDLTFQIFPKPTSQRVLWSETIAGVDVRSGGFFDVILGEVSPMSADLFSQGARWLGVQVSWATAFGSWPSSRSLAGGWTTWRTPSSARTASVAAADSARFPDESIRSTPIFGGSRIG
jgi:hypothetical protein